MALKVWLPLSGDTTNYGLTGATTEAYDATYGNSILGTKALTSGKVHVTMDSAESFAKFTISGWVKEGSNDAGAVLVAVQNGTNNVFKLVKGAEGYSIPAISSETLFTLTNGWNHFAVTADGTTVKAYLDGALVKETTQSASISTANKLTVGGELASETTVEGVTTRTFANAWTGSVSNIKLSDSVASQFEIVAAANAMVVNYSFNGAVSLGTDITLPSGTTAADFGFGDKEHDLSGNEFDASYGNTLPVASSDTAMYSSSMDFTGADAVTSPIIVTTEFANRYTVSVWAKVASGNVATFSNGGSIPAAGADDWHNIAITNSGVMYIDGVASETAVSGLIGTGNCTITIGGSGKISDFRVYAKTLTAAEVLALYKRKAAVDDSGKVIASEFIVNDDVTAPAFSKTGVVSSVGINNWSGQEESPVDVTRFAIYQSTGAVDATDIIEY